MDAVPTTSLPEPTPASNSSASPKSKDDEFVPSETSLHDENQQAHVIGPPGSSLELPEWSAPTSLQESRSNSTGGAMPLQVKSWFDQYLIWTFVSAVVLLVPTLLACLFAKHSGRSVKSSAYHLPDQCLRRVPGAVATLSSDSRFQQCNNVNKQSECATLQALACSSGVGFTGDSNVYGLGIRLSLYLQWGVSILSNYLLLVSQRDLATTYVPILFFYCVYAYIYMSTKSCTFPQEVTILHIIFYSGFTCMYTASVAHTSKAEPEFQGLTRALVTKYALIAFFAIQSIRNSFLAEKNEFVFEFPCPSSAILLGLSFKQPTIGAVSASYDFFDRVADSIVKIQPSMAILILIVSVLILFPQEVASSVRDSDLVQTILGILRKRRKSSAVIHVTETSMTDSNAIASETIHAESQDMSGMQRWINKRKSSVGNGLARIKVEVNPFLSVFVTREPLSGDAQSGRSIAAIATSLWVWIFAIVTIERTIATNAIQSVNNFNDTGQYLALVYALVGCLPVLRDCCDHVFGAFVQTRRREQRDSEQEMV